MTIHHPFDLWLCLYLFLQTIWSLSRGRTLKWVSGPPGAPGSRGARRARGAAARRGGAAGSSRAAGPRTGASSGAAGHLRAPAAPPGLPGACWPGKNWRQRLWGGAPAQSRVRQDAGRSGREYLTTLVYNTRRRAKPRERVTMMAVMTTIMQILMVRKIWSLTQVSALPAVWTLST